MPYTAWTIVILCLLLPLFCLPLTTAADTRPNLVVILADDLGAADLQCCGAPDMRTPALNQLFAAGMKFSNGYANSPVCSPTRAALLSGRYPETTGVPGVIRTDAADSWGYLSPTVELLPVAARKAGYHTAIIGKWHLGLASPNTPLERGFDHFHGFLGDMMDDYYTHRRHDRNYMRLGQAEIAPAGHATDLFADWAVQFLNQQRKDAPPFFLYLAWNAPHTPIQPPAEWLDRVRQREPGISDKRAGLVALIEHMDSGIGRVISALQANGQWENTIVVFTSDNGGQLDVGAGNGQLRDGKQSVYEGGLKVPLCITWPGRIQAGSQTDFSVMSMDILPTLFAAAGVTHANGLDGRSFLPTLLGEQQPALRSQWFFTRREGGLRYGGKTIEAVREGPWKLLQNSPFAPLELYHLQQDPLESQNLVEKHPAIVNRLNAALRRHLQRGGATPWQPPMPADSQ